MEDDRAHRPPVEFIGSPRTVVGALAVGSLSLVFGGAFVWLAVSRWALDSLLWLLIGVPPIAFVMRSALRASMGDVFQLCIGEKEVRWGWSLGSGERTSLAFSDIDHVQVHRPQPYPTVIEVIPKNGLCYVIPDEFTPRHEREILAALAERTEVREPSVHRQLASTTALEGMRAEGKERGERIEAPDGVHWLVITSGSGFRKDQLELLVSAGGVSWGRRDHSEPRQHIAAEDLTALHFWEVDLGDDVRMPHLAFATAQGEFADVQEGLFRSYWPDICHVILTLHPHIQLLREKVPEGCQRQPWPSGLPR